MTKLKSDTSTDQQNLMICFFFFAISHTIFWVVKMCFLNTHFPCYTLHYTPFFFLEQGVTLKYPFWAKM